jgi:molybdopterin/thiamine biosynthesis adenylyltransferase
MSESTNQRVLIVGVGGLGVPVLMALARAAVAGVTLVDPDPIELSNLPRQVIYREPDIGSPKVEAATRWLNEHAPAVAVTTHRCALDESNARELIPHAAFVIDATDSPATKFLINDQCVALNVPFVYGGVIGMTGQAMTVIPHRTACLRCLFEEPPSEDDGASCRDAGIVGPVAGAIGTAQAQEAIRWMRGQTPELAGTMMTYDAKLGRIRLTGITARAGCGCQPGEAQSAERRRARQRNEVERASEFASCVQNKESATCGHKH